MNDEDEVGNDKDDVADMMRTPAEVAERCLVLLGMLAAGHGQPRDKITAWLQGQNLWKAVTPFEAEFLQAEDPPRAQIENATWRAESIHSMLWALERIPELRPPTELCDPSEDIPLMPKLYSDTAEFVAAARLRDEGVIQDQVGEVQHFHWQVRDAELFGRELPEDYEPGAIYERHRALNWVTGYHGQDWDHVSTDT